MTQPPPLLPIPGGSDEGEDPSNPRSGPPRLKARWPYPFAPGSAEEPGYPSLAEVEHALKLAKSFLGGAAETLIPQGIRDPAGAMEGMAQGMAHGPFTGALPSSLSGAEPAINALLGRPIEIAKGLMGAQAGEAQKAMNAPTTSERIGHGLAAALPGIGPAAAHAGEEIGSGDPERMARGAGSGAALIAPMAASALRGKPSGGPPPELPPSDVAGWASEVNPKTKTFGLKGPMGEKLAGKVLPDRIEMTTIYKGKAANSKSAVDALLDFGKSQGKPVYFTSTNLTPLAGEWLGKMIQRGNLVETPQGLMFTE